MTKQFVFIGNDKRSTDFKVTIVEGEDKKAAKIVAMEKMGVKLCNAGWAYSTMAEANASVQRVLGAVHPVGTYTFIEA